jgi:predicted O-methyltransferase YrrM
MRRRIEIGLFVVLVALIVIGIFLAQGKRSEEESLPGPRGAAKLLLPQKEITVRNVLKEVIHYTIKPQGDEGKLLQKSLAVGAIDRISTDKTLVISFMRSGTEIVRSLTPGKPYSFRYDSDGQIEIWQGSHGREDAEDLAPYVPTPMVVVDKMLEMAKVSKSDVVYDIGCGDGRIVIAAAEKFGAQGVGIDIDPERIKESKANAKRANVQSLVKFLEKDATKTDISRATIITLYLLPESNELLRPKLERELKPGVTVVCHNYEIPGWESKQIDSVSLKDEQDQEHTIYLYRR